MRIGLLFEEEAAQGAGDGAQHEKPQQAPILLERRIPADAQSEPLREDLHPIAEEKQEHCNQRSCVKRDVERKAAVIPPENPGDDDQVRATAYGQEFGEPLDDPKDDRVQERHRVRVAQVRNGVSGRIMV